MKGTQFCILCAILFMNEAMRYGAMQDNVLRPGEGYIVPAVVSVVLFAFCLWLSTRFIKKETEAKNSTDSNVQEGK